MGGDLTTAQPETTGLFCRARRYNAPMRTRTLLVFFLCVPLWSLSQKPPESAPRPKSNSTESAQSQKASSEKQERAANEPAIKEITSANPNKGSAEPKATKDLNIDWWIAAFTGVLALVGLLQFVALIVQARVLRHHSGLIQQSVEQMRQAVAAYEGFVRSSEAMLTLTRESNEITARATELTRQSLILVHRPRLIVRHVVVRSQRNAITRELSDIAVAALTIASDGGQLDIVNTGNSRTSITKAHSEMFRGERLPMVPPYDGKPGADFDLSLPAGARCYIPFPSEIYRHEASMVREEHGWERFWVLGWIEYTDDIGTLRRTGFCRQWSNDHRCFMPVDDSRYEYAD